MTFKAIDWDGREVYGHAVMNEGIYTYLTTDSGRTLVDATTVEAVEESEN